MTERDNETVPAVETAATALPAVAVPAVEELPADQDEVGPGPSRGACRTELRGWAGAHLHGAVRPRRRAAGRGRPPGRWC
ncbi:hypothetical protein [Paractinoplanes lichenicola]